MGGSDEGCAFGGGEGDVGCDAEIAELDGAAGGEEDVCAGGGLVWGL